VKIILSEYATENKNIMLNTVTQLSKVQEMMLTGRVCLLKSLSFIAV